MSRQAPRLARRPRHQALLPLAILAWLGYCAGALPASQRADLPFEVLLDESQSGFERPVQQKVADPETWAKVWRQVQARVSPAPPLPEVDFARETLLVVAAGEKRSGGIGIAVRRITREGGSLVVEVHERCPPAGAQVLTVLTYPVQIVRLQLQAAPDEPLRFRTTRDPDCRK